ncbi:MAG: hypothetical protein LKJ17_10925 [Oscillospiraceae bacterium]|jgi:hypothetical protein|nr:hypothetical protein [Oscillospiraceae bacterium]
MSSKSTKNAKNSKPPEPEEPQPPHPACQESKLVPDESEEYEEQQTGIELSYVLTAQEIYECLKYSSRLYRNRVVSILAIVVPLGLAAGFLIAGLVTYRSSFYSIAVFFAALAAFLVGYPYRKNRARAHAAADGHTTRMAIYPDRIEVDRKPGRMEIPMDGTAEFLQIRDLLVIDAAGTVLIIPVRCMKPRILPDVQAMILAGTKPKKC